jgi:hypothetical protein
MGKWALGSVGGFFFKFGNTFVSLRYSIFEILANFVTIAKCHEVLLKEYVNQLYFTTNYCLLHARKFCHKMCKFLIKEDD